MLNMNMMDRGFRVIDRTARERKARWLSKPENRARKYAAELAWQRRNRARKRAWGRKAGERERELLTDHYVLKAMWGDDAARLGPTTPRSMIDLHRRIIMLKRLCRNRKTSTT